MILELVYKQFTAGKEPQTSAIAKVKSKAVRKYLLQFDWLTLVKCVLHHLYINNNVEYHQLILPVKYHQGHQGLEGTLALCQERFYWNTMFQDDTNYAKLSMMPNCEG